MKITKPKRQSNGTYLGDIFITGSYPVKIKVKEAYILSVKQINRDVSDDGEPAYALSFKQSLYRSIFCDITAQVLQIVKDNCNSWFKVSLTHDTIEDYFINNVLYDKNRGEFIRVKCINDVSQVPINVTANLEISLQHIRFYKQQFVLEWMLDEVEIIEGKTTEEDDIPAPTEDDITCIKARARYLGESLIHDYDSNIVRLSKRIKLIQSALNNLKISQDINDVLLLEDGLEEISEAIYKNRDASTYGQEDDDRWEAFKNKFSLS